MIRRPLVLALVIALAPAAASAEDLLQVYALARDSDPQLAASQSGRLATREGEVQARAALLPQINGSASLDKSRSEGPSSQTQFDPTTGEPVRFSGDTQSNTTTRSLGVDVQQMVFDRSRFTILKSQQALSRASDFNLEAADDSLITRTSAAYFNTLVAIETLTAAEASEAALKKQFDAASKRLEVGLAPITDVHEARAQYDSARANTIVARNAVLDSYQALAEITGKPVGALKALPEDFQPTLPEHGGVESFVARAIENNPSLHAAEEQLASANENIETARSGHWPTLYLNGSYGDRKTTGDSTFSSGSLSSTNPIDSQSRGPSVGVTLNVPIFSGGAVSSRVRQSIANRDVVADQVEQQRRALVRNTNAAYQALAAGITEVESRRAALISARAAFEASQVGLEVGTRTVLDVLNNQQNVFVAQRLYSQARYTFLQARLLLAQSVGTLGIDDLQEVNRLLTVSAPPPIPVTP
ncbi:TolC family outer membrane protein [Lysobacter claricitrinus]|uniref:TolC family outer membrane protein n=1 Tax=Lysobacter claricitrinus TaxID=3367728 RepID=UPI0037DB11B7